jgi:NAD+ kinase
MALLPARRWLVRLSFENELDDPRQSDFVARLKERYASLIDDAQPDLVVVVGGDGAMLRALQRRTPKRAAPWNPVRFLGIGRGTLNFLMNPEAVADQLADLDPAALPHHRIYPLWVEQDGEAVGASYNEVVLGGGLMEWHAFRLESGDGAFDDYEIRGSGICISTPLGSTAFNANNRGAVLPLAFPVLSVTGVVANRDLNEIFSGCDLTVSFKSRRGVSMFMDGHSSTALGKSGTVTVRRDDKRWMELAFVDDGEFARRRIELLKAKRK